MNYPDSWQPNTVGDSLAGVVGEKRIATTKYGEKPVAEITTADGTAKSV